MFRENPKEGCCEGRGRSGIERFCFLSSFISVALLWKVLRFFLRICKMCGFFWVFCRLRFTSKKKGICRLGNFQNLLWEQRWREPSRLDSNTSPVFSVMVKNLVCLIIGFAEIMRWLKAIKMFNFCLQLWRSLRLRFRLGTRQMLSTWHTLGGMGKLVLHLVGYESYTHQSIP